MKLKNKKRFINLKLKNIKKYYLLKNKLIIFIKKIIVT